MRVPICVLERSLWPLCRQQVRGGGERPRPGGLTQWTAEGQGPELQGVLKAGDSLDGEHAVGRMTHAWACLCAHGRIIHDRGDGRVKLQVLVWPV